MAAFNSSGSFWCQMPKTQVGSCIETPLKRMNSLKYSFFSTIKK